MLRMPLKKTENCNRRQSENSRFHLRRKFFPGQHTGRSQNIRNSRPILYRKEIRKNGRRLVGYENATGRPIVPFGKYARCHTPIISENRIGIVETDEGKFIAIDHTGKKLFEIMFQSPVLSVEDLFRYGYFIYVTRNGRQESPPSADCDTRNRPTSRSISPTSIGMLSKLLSTDPATLPVSDISPE